jgi:ankyrin repeat protein
MKTANDNNSWMMSTSDKLFQAIEHDNFWMAHILLKASEDLKVTNNEGLNPVEYALKLGRNKLAEFLRSKRESE